MIDLIVTAYGEPKATLRAVKTILKQLPSKKDRVIVVDPFPETENFLKKHIKDKRFVFYLDPGEGKAYALNLLLNEFPGTNEDVFIFTDGDVFISENAIKNILLKFNDKKVGCVCGRPVPIEKRSTKYGFWAHLFFAGIDNTRKKLSSHNKFFECSGYLFAIRKSIVLAFPTETSEDAILPYLIWKKGYKVVYAPEAEVYVKNPANWKDFVNQKVRNIKAHENLRKLAPDMPRTKSFWNEIKEGFLFSIKFARTPKEFWWLTQAYFARLYIYLRAFYELKKGRTYKDGWRETEIKSTRPFD